MVVAQKNYKSDENYEKKKVPFHKAMGRSYVDNMEEDNI